MPVTCGSLPDDALASILGGLSAQEAARAEATSKAFRRLRPRVVAAQSGHVLRDAWDDEIILAAANCTKDNLELAAASFLAMGSPEAWRAWQETWPERWAMPGSVQPYRAYRHVTEAFCCRTTPW